MLKGLVALAIGLLAISPIFVGMATTGVLGGSYITDNNFRHFPPEERSDSYPLVEEITLYANEILQILLVILAFFVFIMTAAEYYKFYRMYKIEEEHMKHMEEHGGEGH
ncbi:MAG: hypothetical protein R6U44_03065 [Archaeoglobaceae archaeon]